MPKRGHIRIHRNDDLAVLDRDLEQAMDRLDGANRTIASLLESMNASPPSEEPSPEASETAGASIPGETFPRASTPSTFPEEDA